MENREESVQENEQHTNDNKDTKQDSNVADETTATTSDKGEDGEKKIAELNDKYLRLYSEFDNYRKRTARERIELSKTAGEEIFRSLLPVLDDFERAIRSVNEDTTVDVFKEGVNLIYSKLKKTLNQKGLEEMKSQGESFDSEIHEALTNIDAPTADLKGKVVEEVEKGYLLNGKVIRHAKVVVGK